MKNIPENLQTDFLTETHGDTIPTILREKANVIYPAFVREETISNEDGSTRTGYRYFNVTVPYTGQNLHDESAFIHASYSALRKHFYGDYAVQNEQILKGTFAAHQYAVRLAFPKSDDASADPVPVKYSTLKIIRTLGNEWTIYRTALESAGYLDQFFAANYLAANDPVFLAFLATVPQEVRSVLSDCIWEPA